LLFDRSSRPRIILMLSLENPSLAVSLLLPVVYNTTTSSDFVVVVVVRLNKQQY
jgi:hypothetical protein